MFCLSWRVISLLSFLVIYSLLLINECVPQETYSRSSKFKVGDLAKGKFDRNYVGDNIVRVKRQGYPYAPPNSPVGQPRNGYFRPGYPIPSPNPFGPHNQFPSPPGRHGGGHQGDCGDDRQWIPPGQRKRGRRPGHRRDDPCEFRHPPGHRRRIWPPPIDHNNRDFKFPSLTEPPLTIGGSENVVYHDDVTVILLKPEEIRK